MSVFLLLWQSVTVLRPYVCQKINTALKAKAILSAS